MLNILASFAEFEREMIATRIAKSRARLKARGRRIAGAVPFGYETDPGTKQFSPSPSEAAATLARLSPLSREASMGMLFPKATHCEKSLEYARRPG
jgi:DNA invertase Pin-like site-specific DNA recombinase